MKTLRITLSISLRIDVPDDSALDVPAVVRGVELVANDWRDGRYPYATELLQEGAQRIVHACVTGQHWLSNGPSFSGWQEKMPVHFWGDDPITAEWIELPENWSELQEPKP